MTYKDIDLKNPNLGAELLKDPKGDFPLDVWESYCRKPFPYLGSYPLPVLSWRVDRSDPKFAPLDPQHAVDEALSEAMGTLLSTGVFRKISIMRSTNEPSASTSVGDLVSSQSWGVGIVASTQSGPVTRVIPP